MNIHIGDHTIPTLIKACNNPMAISAHFQFFANAGVKEYVDHPVIEQFTYSHNPDIHGAEMAIEVKSLLRKDFPLHYLGAHRPFQREDLAPEDQPLRTDCSGRKVPHKFLMHANKRRIRAFPAAGSRNFATLNHYALRSLDSYLVKNDRDDVNRENRAFDYTYWRERNDNAFHDPSITRYLPDLRKEIVYDPTVKEDAMHACLFSTPNVTHLAAPRLGSDLQKHFWEMGVLEVLISEASSGRLNANQFARHMRARRDHLPYLRRLLAQLIDADRAWLQALLCKNTGERLDAPRFRKRYIALKGEDPSFFDKAKVTVNA